MTASAGAILGGSGKRGSATSGNGLLIPATVTTFTAGSALTVTVDGATSAVKATMGWDGTLSVGDRVWLAKVGAQYLAVGRQNAYGLSAVTPRARAYATAATTISTGGTLIPLGALEYSQGGISLSSGTLKFTVEGLYHFSYQVKIAPNTTGINAAILQNGNFISYAGQSDGTTAGYWALAGADDIEISVNDTIQVFATADGSNANLQNDNKHGLTNGGGDNFIACFRIPD